MGKFDVVGSVGFMLHRYMKLMYIGLVLPDNYTGWEQGWFSIDNMAPELPPGLAPVAKPEWSNQLMSRETEDLQPLLDDLEMLKIYGLTGSVVVISFSRWLLQPVQDWVHPSYEYWGQTNPTQVVRCKVSKEETVAWLKSIFVEHIYNWMCPKALCLYRLIRSRKSSSSKSSLIFVI
jgi:hypothetical protein